MAASVLTGPVGFGPPCTCSTVHRLRFSEYRRNFGSSGSPRATGHKSMAISASEKRDERKLREKNDGGGVTRRTMLGFVALASPTLLMANVEADVKEPLKESQLAAHVTSQAFEHRVTGLEIEAPALQEEEIPVSRSSDASSSEDSSTHWKTVFNAALAPTIGEVKAAEAAARVEESKTSQSGSLSFLNGFGVLGSGVLGALYWFEGRAKGASKAALEEANAKLQQAEAAMVSLKETMEKSLTEQQAQSMQKLTESERGRVAIASELDSLKSEARELQLHVESQKNVNQNLDKKVKTYKEAIGEAEVKTRALEDKLVKEEQRRQSLENEIKAAGNQVKEKDQRITILETELKEQGNVGEELKAKLTTTKVALVEAEDRVLDLGKELIVARACFDEREYTVQDLQKSLASALAKVDEVQVELASSRQEINDLEESTRKSLANASAAIATKEEEVSDLISKLAVASSESQEAASNVERLEKEVQKLEKQLQQERASVKELSEELRVATDNLQLKAKELTSLQRDIKSSREEIGQLTKQQKELEAAKEAEVVALREALQAEQVVTTRMKQELDEARTASQASALEVKSLHEKLKEVISSNKRIQRDLEEARRTANATMVTLNEEKKKVAVAEKQFIETQKALAREEMLVESLRSEFSKAMDAMNDLRKHLGSLSRDLQEANLKIAALENDKSCLQESLAREKKATKVLKEKAASAESELTKLLREKNGSVSKASKLETELSVAEAEMLKLKEQMSLMGNVIDSAETRMGSIAQVNLEVSSLVRQYEKLTAKGKEKQRLKQQIDRLKEQSKAATEISKELRNMKQLLSHFQQNLNEAELERVEAETALHAAVKKNAAAAPVAEDEPQRVAATRSESS